MVHKIRWLPWSQKLHSATCPPPVGMPWGPNCGEVFVCFGVPSCTLVRIANSTRSAVLSLLIHTIPSIRAIFETNGHINTAWLKARVLSLSVCLFVLLCLVCLCSRSLPNFECSHIPIYVDAFCKLLLVSRDHGRPIPWTLCKFPDVFIVSAMVLKQFLCCLNIPHPSSFKGQSMLVGFALPLVIAGA